MAGREAGGAAARRAASGGARRRPPTGLGTCGLLLTLLLPLLPPEGRFCAPAPPARPPPLRAAGGAAAAAAEGASSAAAPEADVGRAERAIRSMYAAVLAGDVDAAMALVDPEVVYEDTTFPEPLDYDGVRALFGQVREKLPEDFAFVIDEVADGGTAVGLTYHAELSGTPLQGSKGTAFYRYNPETFKLVYCRECNEPSVKMGSGALDMLRVMAPFLRGPQ